MPQFPVAAAVPGSGLPVPLLSCPQPRRLRRQESLPHTTCKSL